MIFVLVFVVVRNCSFFRVIEVVLFLRIWGCRRGFGRRFFDDVSVFLVLL